MRELIAARRLRKTNQRIFPASVWMSQLASDRVSGAVFFHERRGKRIGAASTNR